MIWRKKPEGSIEPPPRLPEFLERFAEALPDPALILDARGLVIAANLAALEVLGRDPRGQPLSLSIRAPDVLAALQRMLEHGEPERTELTLRVPVAQSFEVHIAPLDPAAPGAPAGLLLLRDISREQRIERMRADFVANASHELRTPLASVLGLIETLQGPARTDTAAREKFLTLMKSQALRMSRLIGDLLSLSRIETREHHRPSDRVDLGQIARHVADSLAVLARDGGAAIEIDVTSPLPVTGDHDELVQVAQNLVENALNHAGTAKRVAIGGGVEDGFVTLTVRDWGPGIAPEHIPRLTERFYRVDAQQSRARGGTGLGLAIVKHILNRHRGKLLVRSTPGEGSSFTIRLPRAE
jgi:two-component system, OmpR family, phosphate regulon sensor histidine kinase PhoR